MIKIYEYGKVSDDEIFSRCESISKVEATVSEIIGTVREKGDAALREYSKKFDKADLTELLVSEDEIDEAVSSVEPEFIRVLERAAQNIREFHSKQIRNSFIISEKNGIVCGQKIIPIENVGLYVPGGTAAYPSTVLMDSIPAKLAGCKNLVMVTPPSADGKINPAILAAAKIAGIDRIFKVGGAQAIAALAYGNREHSKGGQDSGPRKRLCGGGKKAGLRQSLHRHDSGSQRDTGHPRTKKASPPTSPPTSFPRLSTTASRARFLSQTPPSLPTRYLSR